MSTKLHRPITFETAFSKYVASSILGEGGAGKVYDVVDETGNRFAIKALDPEKASREKIKRFKNELYFCLRNQHKNIITVLDHGVHYFDKKSTPFYVMPFYPKSLRDLISSGINVDKSIIYFGQMLDGVEAAHLQKVNHRDLKPENILYDPQDDCLLIADFGTAQFSEEELYTLVETKPGTRLANFQYAAPEQRARGQHIDHRADIFALGLMLNEIFTKETPQGTNYKTIESVTTQFAYLDQIVSSMLRQSPLERPVSIEVIKQELIARKNEFVTLQRISDLQKIVVPISEIDDPIITDPIRLINFDWNKGNLILYLNQPVNDRWISAIKHPGSHTSVFGKGPERFAYDGDKAYIDVLEQDVQRVIDYFKQWLPNANEKYEQLIRNEQTEKERRQRQELQSALEEQERRERILKNVRI
jgi:serine/threonine protein kinase